MKNTLLLLAGLSLFASQTNAAPSTVILNFDDVPGGSIQGQYGSMPTYKGFNFSSMFYWSDLRNILIIEEPAISGDFVLTVSPTIETQTITEANGEDFTFDGLWAATSIPDGYYIDVGLLEGYKNGAQVWSMPIYLNNSFEYYGPQSGLIDELKLNLGTDFIVDNIELTTVSPVPESSSIALMLGGLGLVGFMAARRTKKV